MIRPATRQRKPSEKRKVTEYLYHIMHYYLIESAAEGQEIKKRQISSIAAADSGQFHLYRKTRRHELDRIQSFEEQKLEEAADEEHFRRQEEVKRKFAEKTEKNRARRQKRKNLKVKSDDARA